MSELAKINPRIRARQNKVLWRNEGQDIIAGVFVAVTLGVWSMVFYLI